MKRLTKLLARVLDINENMINDDTSPENVDTWDSFNGLMMVSELEKEFNVKFTMDEIVAVERVADIKYYLKKHGVELENE